MFNTVIEAAANGPSIVNDVFNIIGNAATIFGGAWALFGGMSLAVGLKEHNSPQTQSGIWQLVGAVIIFAVAGLFKTLATVQ